MGYIDNLLLNGHPQAVPLQSRHNVVAPLVVALLKYTMMLIKKQSRLFRQFFQNKYRAILINGHPQGMPLRWFRQQ